MFLEFLEALNTGSFITEIVTPDKYDSVTFKYIKNKIKDLEQAQELHKSEGVIKE